MSNIAYLASKPSVMVPSFYVATTGSDSNPGSFTQPFLTFSRAGSAMNSSSTKITNIRSGTYNFTGAWVPSSNQSWFGYPGDPANSATLNLPVSGSGVFGASNLTIKNLTINSSANDGGAALLFGDCPNLVVQSCLGTITRYQQWIEVFRPGGGLRIQGNNLTGPTIGNNGTQGIFLINIVVANGANFNDSAGYIISDNTLVGGTFPIQVQCQNVNGVWSNWHCDRNNLTGWGSSVSTIGNEGISWVGSSNSACTLNTCTGNVMTQGAGAFTGGGIEAASAGCTYQNNVMTANFGFSIAGTFNSRYLGNTINSTSMAFSNDGSGYTAAVATTVEVDTNTINGTPTAGAGSPTNLSPLPSGSGQPINAPSAQYVG